MNRVAAHCARAPRSVLYDAERAQVLDVASGKTLSVEGAVVDAGPPLRLELPGGRSVALTEAGLAFAPGFENTGVLEELASQVSWREFFERVGRLRAALYGPESTVGASTVRELLCCLAIVDGARAVGMEVAEQEQELEWHLAELERRAPG